jgi:hypothetical protein
MTEQPNIIPDDATITQQYPYPLTDNGEPEQPV